MSQEQYLSMENICKAFYGVKVLENLNFSVGKGETRALIGENGAGKSTLMNILCGVYSKDAGTIRIDGKTMEFRNPKDARDNKICMIHQELSLAQNLSVAENIYLGAELSKGVFSDLKEMRRKVSVILDELGLTVSPYEKVSRLSVAQQQLVEIARALIFDASIVIFDEPTAAISEAEAEKLFAQIRKLKQKDISVIFISHRLEELFEICDSITVMRDGKIIDTKSVSELTQDDLISMMVGRSIERMFGTRSRPVGTETFLEVKHLKNKYLKDVSYELKRGEILGFAGLVGAGRSEMARAVFGIDKLDEGEVWLEGRKIDIRKPADAIKYGIGFVTEDRKKTGLLLKQSIAYNLTLLVVNKFKKMGKVDRKKENEIVEKYAHKLSIKMTGPSQHCTKLSGGNQQKVVISKWLAFEPKVLILDEPTRGIDVGAKSEIYELINTLADEGYSIIMISSELPEIINISSRIVVMHEGAIQTVLDNSEEKVTQETIMKYAVGGE